MTQLIENAFVSKFKSKTRPWIICLSAALFFFYEFLQINMFSSVMPHLIREFNISSIMAGILSASYLTGNIIFIFPAGLLLDIASPRKLILIAMSISVAGTFLFSFSSTVTIAMIGRFIAGASAGPFCFLGVMKLISQWFKTEKTAFVTGVVVSFAMVGGIVSQTPFIWMTSRYGWRNVLLFNSMIGLFFVFWMYFFVFDRKKNKIYTNKLFKKDIIKILNDVKAVVVFKQNWFCSIFASLINLPILILGAVWGCSYIYNVHNLSYEKASVVTTMLYAGMLVGSPMFGCLSDVSKKRRLPMLIGSIICLLASLLIMIVKFSFFTFLILFFLLGFGSSSQIIAYPTVSERNPIHLTGTSVGLATTLIMSGGAIFQFLFGFILDFFQNYSNESGYQYAFSILPISIIISIILLLNIPETRCE